MRRFFLLSLLAMIQVVVFSQKVFFKSAQTFSKADMQEFYSSVAVAGDRILFNALDYKLYVYRKDGVIDWEVKTGYKTAIPPFVVGNNVWVTTHENDQEAVKRFNLENGAASPVPGISAIYTRPFFRNNVLYATGLSDGGCLFAYDLAADSMLWQRFIAHGNSAAPYYLPDRIVANVEVNNWIDLLYDNGKLKDRDCEDPPGQYPSLLKCVKIFNALSHDGIEINNRNAGKWWPEDGIANPVIRYSANRTFVFWDAQMVVLGDRMKIKSTVSFGSFDEKIDDRGDPSNTIVAQDEERAWVLCSGQLIKFNHKKQKLERIYDLAAWDPYKLVLDHRSVWLISRTDGLLYGISLD